MPVLFHIHAFMIPSAGVGGWSGFAVVRKEGLATLLIFGFWPKTSQISSKKRLSPAMSPLRHRSVFGAKSAENGKLRKVRFSCPVSFVLPGPSNSPKTLPRKTCEFQPAELVISNTSACRGTAQSQPVSNAAARQAPGSEPDSPAEVLPRTTAAR